MEPPRILVVDDEPENLKALERTLRPKYAVITSTDPKAALALLEKEDFSVLLSDQKMPGMLGTELLAKAAKVRPLTTRILLTAHTETQILLDAINRAEIYRYLTKPWENLDLLGAIEQGVERQRLLRENGKLISALEGREAELKKFNEDLERTVAERTAELRDANERLSKLAMTDPLTKILNRRAFFSRCAEEVERSKRYSRPMAIVMIDVDRFKQFNDMEGHLRGDEALKRIAHTLQTSLRKTDILGRYGGEEFILVMPETSLPNAVEICERLRAAIEELEFQGKEEPAYLTISVGVAAYPDQGSDLESLAEAADQSLYRAKQAGRNRVVY